jgi:ribosome maturation factor RimP
VALGGYGRRERRARRAKSSRREEVSGPVSQEVEDAVRSALTGSDLELYDVEIGQGVVRVTVEAEGGVDLDLISLVSGRVSKALDDVAAPDLEGPYTLEVSSPGLERALRRPEHFRRAVGSEVAVRTRPGVPGGRRLDGELAEADAEGFWLVVEGGERRRLSYGDVDRAHTVFRWGAERRGGTAPKVTRKAPAR